MTRPNLEQMLARAEAATEGPWDSDAFSVSEGQFDAHIFGRHENILCHDASWQMSSGDLRFIAAARTDLPAAVRYAMELERSLYASHGLASGGEPCTCPFCTAVRARENP